MVVIDNENENQFLIDHRNKKHIGNQYWIGLKRLSTSADRSADFAWVHGSDNGFRDWKDRNPDVILYNHSYTIVIQTIILLKIKEIFK